MQTDSGRAFAVFVRQLNNQSTKESLFQYFSRFGPVAEVNISHKKKEMKQNYAVVEFETPQALKSCLSSKDKIFSDAGYRVEKMLEGNKLSQRNQDMGNYRIYVGFIPKSFSEGDLRKNFERFGEVDEAYINSQVQVADGSSVSSYFGFVTFRDSSVAYTLVDKGKIDIIPEIRRRREVPDFRALKCQEWKITKPGLFYSA